jgi:hypothetical protein
MKEKLEKIKAKLEEKVKEWDLLPKDKENLTIRVEKAKVLIVEKLDDVYQLFADEGLVVEKEFLAMLMYQQLRQAIHDVTWGTQVRVVKEEKEI